MSKITRNVLPVLPVRGAGTGAVWVDSEHFSIDLEHSEPSIDSLDIIDQILKEKYFCDFFDQKIIFLMKKAHFSA